MTKWPSPCTVAFIARGGFWLAFPMEANEVPALKLHSSEWLRSPDILVGRGGTPDQAVQDLATKLTPVTTGGGMRWTAITLNGAWEAGPFASYNLAREAAWLECIRTEASSQAVVTGEDDEIVERTYEIYEAQKAQGTVGQRPPAYTPPRPQEPDDEAPDPEEED